MWEAHAEAGSVFLLSDKQPRTQDNCQVRKGLWRGSHHTHVTQSVREYLQGNACTPASSVRKAEYYVYELAAPDMLLLFFPFVKSSFSIEIMSN